MESKIMIGGVNYAVFTAGGPNILLDFVLFHFASMIGSLLQSQYGEDLTEFIFRMGNAIMIIIDRGTSNNGRSWKNKGFTTRVG